MGTIQRLCDECGAEKEKEKEKQPETLQAKAEISEAKDYTQNTFSSIKVDEKTEIWQPKNIERINDKIVARNELTQPSITKAKPSRIRAKKLDELFGKKETLPVGEIASPQSEVTETTETEGLHQPIQAKLTVGEAGDKYEQEAVTPEQKISPVLESQRSPTIQRLQQEIKKQAPAGTIPIENFIKLVENEEAQYPNSNTNTKLMITRLRKIFYDTENWNNKLIPGTADIKPHYTPEVVKERTRNFTLDGNGEDWGGKFDISQTESIAKDKDGDIPEIAKHPNIKLKDGSYLDIGHVLAGVDAMNHQDSIKIGFPPYEFKIESNVAASTWVGDLGSVLAEFWIEKTYRQNEPAEARKQDIINYYASSEDMLGNIDAYVIGKNFNIAASEGKKVSEILREYYLGEKINPKATKARLNRYSNFASSVGLDLESKNPPKFGNRETWLDQYATEVSNAAALYIGSIAKSKTDWDMIKYADKMSNDKEGGKALLTLFLDALEKLIKTEP